MGDPRGRMTERLLRLRQRYLRRVERERRLAKVYEEKLRALAVVEEDLKRQYLREEAFRAV